MDRKTLLAMLIIGVILILWKPYVDLVNPPRENPSDTLFVSDTTQPTARRQEVTRERAPVEARAQDVTSVTGAQPYQGMDADTSGQPAWYEPDPEDAGDIVTVETPLYSARFNTRGATVTSWIIKPTEPFLRKPEVIELVRDRDSHRNLTLSAEIRDQRRTFDTGTKVFEVDRDRLVLSEADSNGTLVFTLPLGGDTYYRETYVFHADRYRVDIYLESHGFGELTGAMQAQFGWGGGLAITETDTSQDHFYTQAYYLMGGEKETFKSKGKEAEELMPLGSTRWVAQRTKYFLLALAPETPAMGARMYTWPDPKYKGKHLPQLFETDLLFGIPQGDVNRHVTMYFGPLEQDAVTAVDPTLEQTMSWGWDIIKPFSKGILWTLVFLHGFIPNYGLVLIVFAILIKLIVWPLTHKSYQSTKRMQLLQPLMKKIQAKYKSDPQKMNSEVMGLYKKYKVNPAGGCWPMLLQMPLFYSLFIIFRSTIELRNMPFVLWINDLSQPDVLFHLPFSIPFYGNHLAVLPIVMAITMFLQMKSTTTDPNQKMMVYMMPGLFIFLFNQFPSGLTLYYTLFNLLSWGQQRFMKAGGDPGLEKEIQEAIAELEKQGKGKKGKKK